MCFKDNCDGGNIEDLDDLTQCKLDYERFRVTFDYEKRTHYCLCLANQFELPLKIAQQQSWIQAVYLCYDSSSNVDVTDTILKYCGKGQDFYGKSIKFSWIFQGVNAKLKFESVYGDNFTIDILTNTETDNKEDILEEKYNLHLCSELNEFNVENVVF
jgi:hypothetical protein|tara:strand:- start:121 stop:594 length:474 start_codon:yes stop_codon:yes gene_type:complete